MIVGLSYADVYESTMMVESFYAPVAGFAVLGVLEYVLFAVLAIAYLARLILSDFNIYLTYCLLDYPDRSSLCRRIRQSDQ